MAEKTLQATGRRKEATARVRLIEGSSGIKINGRDIDKYFSRETLIMIVEQPLELTETLKQFTVLANVKGGGPSGQAGAIRHGITRALIQFNESFRSPLRKQGYVTRDPRAKERKKYGQKGARRKFQFTKR